MLAVIAILPIILGAVANMNISMGGTSIIIIVVGVALDTARSLESQMMMRHYKGLPGISPDKRKQNHDEIDYVWPSRSRQGHPSGYPGPTLRDQKISTGDALRDVIRSGSELGRAGERPDGPGKICAGMKS